MADGFDLGAALGNPGTDLTAVGGLAGVAGGIINSQATAQGDLQAAQGYTTEANFYGQAATIAGQNVQIEQANGLVNRSTTLSSTTGRPCSSTEPVAKFPT